MRLWIYTIAWNEEIFLPAFLQHYAPIAEHIVVFDNQSTDRTAEILDRHPKAERRELDTGGRFRDDVHMYLKNEAWKEARGLADWVVAVDADELIHHPDLEGLLGSDRARTVDVWMPYGYDMVAMDLPAAGPVVQQLPMGVASRPYSKAALFRPDRVQDMHYGPGCHACHPVGCEGAVHMHRDLDLKLLHYKFIGGPEHVAARYAQYHGRLSRENVRQGWGHQYADPIDELRRTFAGLQARAVDVHHEVGWQVARPPAPLDLSD